MNYSHDGIHSSLLQKWIEHAEALCKPLAVHVCDGSDEEFQALCQGLVEKGVFLPLNPLLRPESFLTRSHPDDTARVEENTFICSKKKEDAGPTNHWEDPVSMRKRLHQLFDGCMQGRTMYVVPFCMGPLDSPLARFAVEITDSPYVVCHMHLMTRMGKRALAEIKKGKQWIPCMHSVGAPLKEGEQDVAWPCRPDQRWIVHFPEDREIWSFGSGYGGNALLGKKSLALRIASVLARDEGWLAEHMLIVGITNPRGEKHYITGAFPSACGKTNLAMLKAAFPGWKVECVGDDIAWMRFGADGKLYAVNPEAGFFGVAPGTSKESNPHAMQAIARRAIFTNVALTSEGDVWWEGMTKEPPKGLTDWRGHPWDPNSGMKAAHPNSRFTVAITQCPVLDPAWDSAQGVPISAILLGSRRAATMPLVFAARSWEHGVFLGSALASETTAAAAGEMGKVRNDPFAMLPFCGYNMADYWAHWLRIGLKTDHVTLPRMYQVNWFRKGANNQFLWPGFGENIRVIEWIFDCLAGRAKGEESILGIIPKKDELDIEGLTASFEQLFQMDLQGIREDVKRLESFYDAFGDRIPEKLREQMQELDKKLS
ncbi:MAG: phosphoenolpyruvate carboxykinase (GTP) [Simkania sp.]|nr:phosphoenolpyruvate carboxykinase (GTP) [Simkania sp.]